MSIAYALTEFGRALGLGALDLPSDGVINMQWGGDARLSLEEAGDDVLIYVTIPTPFFESSQVLHVLQESDVRRNPPHEPVIQVGMNGQGANVQTTLLMRWPAHNVQASQLHASVQTFERCRREWLGQGV